MYNRQQRNVIFKKTIFLYLVYVFMIIFVQSSSAVDNPISSDRRINDCDVIKYNGEYYITGNWLNGNMLSSDDLENWGEEKHVFSWDNEWHKQMNPNPDKDIHASHIRYENGFFHLYTQLDVYDGITHAVSRDIWGPYKEPHIKEAFLGGPVIDAETFVDDDGSWYFYYDYRVGSSGHEIRVRNMPNPWTLSDSFTMQINAVGGWEGEVVNEGPKVFKYRDNYYMLYNANGTGDPNYAIGCVEASLPTTFSNSNKYGYPVIKRRVPAPGEEEITHIGQSWVVNGLNGFEKWLGYFGQTKSGGRTQRIDRMHFFDRKVFIDGPTVSSTPGYHPGPAKPQLLSIFSSSDGSMSEDDWTPVTPGKWGISDEQAYQKDQNTFSFNLANREAAINYLFEANLKFPQPRDAEDKAGVIAYYSDPNNYVLVGLDRSNKGAHDNWYMHIKENGKDRLHFGYFNGSIDYSVYHKIRVLKNGSKFNLRIDGLVPPQFSTVETGFKQPGVPGLFTDHAAAFFDGVIYTIGWDEYDKNITGWADNCNGVSKKGNWNITDDGIKMEKGTGRIFKGDLMPRYEFSTQVYKVSEIDGLMGITAVAIDEDNYLNAQIDTYRDELFVTGFKDGSALENRRVYVGDGDNYNIRAVKLSDRVIFFVNGHQVMTYPADFGPSQVGLAVDKMSARFNGIMVYQTEQDEEAAEH